MFVFSLFRKERNPGQGGLELKFVGSTVVLMEVEQPFATEDEVVIGPLSVFLWDFCEVRFLLTLNRSPCLVDKEELQESQIKGTR